MKRLLLLLGWLTLGLTLAAQTRPFRFAFISDTHIGSPNGTAEEDLRRTVRDINAREDIAFVVLTGDITELGTDAELRLAKQILDSLDVPWYIIPGNHDSGWSESGGLMFEKVFGYDRFHFTWAGVHFIGCASGPYLRMSDGHVPRHHLGWLDKQLKQLKPGEPLVFLNHYPLDPGLDNWYEITDRLRRFRTRMVLCGHGHANKAYDFESVPGIMGRSNLRARGSEGGYNLVDFSADSALFTERKPVSGAEKTWHRQGLPSQLFDTLRSFVRPDFSINQRYPLVKAAWLKQAPANIISTPATDGKLFYVGNQGGEFSAYELGTGKKRWTYQAGAPVFSSPAVSGNRVVVGTAGGSILCLSTTKSGLIWRYKAGAAVLGSPLIAGDTVFIGASDGQFRALRLSTGKLIWSFTGLQGPVVSTPLLYEGQVIFGAWDRHLYALDRTTGQLRWKWNNGSPVRNFSPAACIPVAANGIVYIVAPDRCITAIDAQTGSTLWRNKETTVRESVGISSDGNWVFGKTMQDTLVAFAAARDPQRPAWKLHCGFGYEHVPSMIVERDGWLYFGTRSGVVYCVDPVKRDVRWAHKLDNSMVNTVRATDSGILVTTMDGKLALLREED